MTIETASAASLADLGLNGTLPAGWTLEKENKIYSIADENEDLICGISYLNLPVTEKELQELQKELAESDSEYVDYSKSTLATVLHKGYKLFVLSAPSKNFPDYYAHDVKLRYGDSVYCLYFFSDDVEQFKVADIWSLYLVKSEGRKIIHFVDFDLRKNSFRLTWTDYINNSRPIYDYLDQLQKPSKK